jgi:DMSO/TMAO reductase YedYZ heme-binding membrane subunit
LTEVVTAVDQTVLDEAARLFVRDNTSDPGGTAITFGAALVLLKGPLAQASTEEVLREVGRYWSGVASLQFRAYALGHDKQVLGFRLAAQRAEAALRNRLRS